MLSACCTGSPGPCWRCSSTFATPRCSRWGTRSSTASTSSTGTATSSPTVNASASLSGRCCSSCPNSASDVVRLALAALPVGVILWLTFVQPGRRATKQQRCCLRGVVLTEIVALGDSVLVGYRGGWGSWLTADPDAAVVRVRTGLRDVGGQIFLPELVQDARAMELLY